jgi:hypothetical protein
MTALNAYYYLIRDGSEADDRQNSVQRRNRRPLHIGTEVAGGLEAPTGSIAW